MQDTNSEADSLSFHVVMFENQFNRSFDTDHVKLGEDASW